MDTTADQGVLARPPQVLVVGQGPPARGGIPSYVTGLMDDPRLGERIAMRFLNTTPLGTKRPAALNASNLRLALFHAWTLLRRARRADVVHLNLAPAPSLPLLRALLLCAAAKLGGARVILHAHTGRLHRCAERPAYRFLLRLVPMVTDRIIVVSQEAKDALDAIGVDAVHLENGIDVDRIPAGPKDADPPILLFVGTVCARKGLIDLRDALIQLSNTKAGPRLPVRPIIVGDSRQEGPGVWEDMVKSYRACGLMGVEFPGALEHPAVVSLLSRASIFCLPSHWEGFSLSLLEAMAGGAAVVTTRVGDSSVLVEDGLSGILVEPRDPSGLAHAIESLVEDPDRRRRLGMAARGRVEERYSWARMSKRLNEIYRDLAQSM